MSSTQAANSSAPRRLAESSEVDSPPLPHQDTVSEPTPGSDPYLRSAMLLVHDRMAEMERRLESLESDRAGSTAADVADLAETLTDTHADCHSCVHPAFSTQMPDDADHSAGYWGTLTRGVGSVLSAGYEGLEFASLVIGAGGLLVLGMGTAHAVSQVAREQLQGGDGQTAREVVDGTVSMLGGKMWGLLGVESKA